MQADANIEQVTHEAQNSLDTTRTQDTARTIPQFILELLSIPSFNTMVPDVLSSDKFLDTPVSIPLDGARYTADILPDYDQNRETLWTSVRQTLPQLKQLRQLFDGALEGKAQSITIGNQAYPLWFEHLVFNCKSYLDKREPWVASDSWLEHISLDMHSDDEVYDLVESVRARLSSLPFSVPTPIRNRAHILMSPDLAILLGESSESKRNWITDEIINAGSDWILKRLGPHSRTHILNSFFIEYISANFGRIPHYSPKRLSSTEQALKDRLLDAVFIPLFVNKSHWSLVKIDIRRHTISYADTLRPFASIPPTSLAAITWWLDGILPNDSFRVKSVPDFPVPSQQDSHSCGVAVLSMLAHLLLNMPAWRQRTSRTEHL
jgi:hypothetical protein